MVFVVLNSHWLWCGRMVWGKQDHRSGEGDLDQGGGSEDRGVLLKFRPKILCSSCFLSQPSVFCPGIDSGTLLLPLGEILSFCP